MSENAVYYNRFDSYSLSNKNKKNIQSNREHATWHLNEYIEKKLKRKFHASRLDRIETHGFEGIGSTFLLLNLHIYSRRIIGLLAHILYNHVKYHILENVKSITLYFIIFICKSKLDFLSNFHYYSFSVERIISVLDFR